MFNSISSVKTKGFIYYVFISLYLTRKKNPIEITNLFFKGVLAKTAAQITTI